MKIYSKIIIFLSLFLCNILYAYDEFNSVVSGIKKCSNPAVTIYSLKYIEKIIFIDHYTIPFIKENAIQKEISDPTIKEKLLSSIKAAEFYNLEKIIDYKVKHPWPGYFAFLSIQCEDDKYEIYFNSSRFLHGEEYLNVGELSFADKYYPFYTSDELFTVINEVISGMFTEKESLMYFKEKFNFKTLTGEER